VLDVDIEPNPAERAPGVRETAPTRVSDSVSRAGFTGNDMECEFVSGLLKNTLAFIACDNSPSRMPRGLA
jgi:hypothetical protein